MAGSSNNHGLTPREIEFIVNAMITLVEKNVKPDFEKLAKMSNYKDANAASKNWHHTATKLKAAAKKADGETNDFLPTVGKRTAKREADDDFVAPPTKRGRGRGRARTTAQPPAEEDDEEAGEV